MAIPRVFAIDRWVRTGRPPAQETYHVNTLQPATDGQIYEIPMTAIASVDDPSVVAKVQLLGKMAGVTSTLGETATPDPEGLYIIQTSSEVTPGIYELWVRAVGLDGSFSDGTHRVTELTLEVQPLRIELIRPATNNEEVNLPYQVMVSVTDMDVVEKLELFEVTSDVGMRMVQPSTATTDLQSAGSTNFSADGGSTSLNSRVRQVRFYARYDPVQLVNNLASSFGTRQDWALDQLAAITGESGDAPDWQVGKGIAKLEKARKLPAGPERDVYRAGGNGDIQTGAGYFGDSYAAGGERESLTQLYHAGPLVMCRALLRYKPLGLIDTATETAIKTNLQTLKNRVFGIINNGRFDILNGAWNPWVPFWPDPPNTGQGYAITENHKLSTIVSGLLLAEVFAGETNRGVAVKGGNLSDPNPTLSHWHYFRDALYRYEAQWPDTFPHHTAKDVPALETNAVSYHHVYLGDYWALRDLCSDAAVKAWAEVQILRLLATYVQAAPKGLWGGHHQRSYHASHQATGPHHAWAWLLFDNMRARPPAGDFNLGWGRWCHWAAMTSDFNPGNHAAFKPLIDLAWNRRGSYDITQGDRQEHLHVERDFVLGFLLRDTVNQEGLGGGVHVHTEAFKGCIAMPFHGSGPFRKSKPTRTGRGVMSGPCAIQRYTSNEGGNQRLWLSVDANGGKPWTIDATRNTWLFLMATSSEGRSIFVAVRQAGGTRSSINLSGTASSEAGQSAGADVAGGVTYEFSDATLPLVWEVRSSDDYPVAGANLVAMLSASFEAFKTDVLNQEPTVTADEVRYTSSKQNATLVYRRNDDAHSVLPWGNVNWATYDRTHGSPFCGSTHNSYQLRLMSGAFETLLDWDTSPSSVGTAGLMGVGEVPAITHPSPGAVFAGPRDALYLGQATTYTLGFATPAVDLFRLPKGPYEVFPLTLFDDGTQDEGPSVPWTLA